MVARDGAWPAEARATINAGSNYPTSYMTYRLPSRVSVVLRFVGVLWEWVDGKDW